MGYCYGNVKIHKPGNKLRPIISQIPTPTYTIAKRLCATLTPYVPSTYSLTSAADFLDILKSNNTKGNIASLDVESLFTNVPIDRTIEYILQRVYHNDDTPSLDIPEPTLRSLLECCTKEAPFTCPRGNKYQQVDGVAMGSPLGVLMANFFMGCIEEEAFKTTKRPDIYCRYIDDIFIKTTSTEDAEHLRRLLQELSGLNFTIEHSTNGSMPFLDILVKQDQDAFNTAVYVKATNPGHCLNGRSECPKRYKDSTIGAYIRRALTHCSNWQQVHHEIDRSTQVLLNNGFDKADIYRQTRKIMDHWHAATSNTTEEKNNINIYYKSHFSTAYKEDERIMKQIIRRNVTPTDPEKKLNIVIYYKSKKTSHLIMRNSPQEEKTPTQESHVVYRFICKRGICEALPSTYIGMTTMKLSRRMSYHLTSGAPRQHLLQKHNTVLTRKILEENTDIIARCPDERRLPILEALNIKEMEPNLNKQALDLQALPSMRRSAAHQPNQSAAGAQHGEGDDTP
ncbi:uncharacterized protein LOC126994416 [Eriocheir sinensis]|uniref:uncharacterized protein LOC126994416 n=1 Tax=Eriocheir sinensis TaxID=95602 RepID=UPI0021CA6910|nr:uncharacterized protein LOC126994416 [Eriocheir sinensis]